MYARLAKAFYFLSIFFFLISFLYIYSGSPEFVTYEVSERGFPLKQISKDFFFYLIVGIFLISNILLVLPAKLIEMQYSPAIRRVFPVGDVFRESILAWFFSFTAILNLSTIVFVFYLHSLTDSDGSVGMGLKFFFYLVPILFVGWIGGLFYILATKIKHAKNQSE